MKNNINSSAGRVVYVILNCCLIIYAIAMLLAPMATILINQRPGLFNLWIELQKIWYDWQTYNSAMIALFATAILYRFATYQDSQRTLELKVVYRIKLMSRLSDVDAFINSAVKVLETSLHVLPSYKRGNSINIPVTEIAEYCSIAEGEVVDFLANFAVRMTSIAIKIDHVESNYAAYRRDRDAVIGTLIEIANLKARLSALSAHLIEGKNMPDTFDCKEFIEQFDLPPIVKSSCRNYLIINQEK